MRNHLVSLCLCFLFFPLASSTCLVVLNLGLCFKQVFFHVPLVLVSLNFVLIYFFNVQSVCTQSRNGPQKSSGWIQAAVIWMPVLEPLWVLYFLLTGKYLQVLHQRDPTADSITHMPGCVPICVCVPRWVYISQVLSPQFLLSSLKLLWGLFCLAGPNANAAHDLEWFAIQKALSQYCHLRINLE